MTEISSGEIGNKQLIRIGWGEVYDPDTRTTGRYLRYYYFLILLIFFFTPYAFAYAEEGNKCLEYEPAVVTLTGVIEQRVYEGGIEWGPKKYRKIPYLYWALIPNDPICVKPLEGDTWDWDVEEYEVRVMQVAYNAAPKFSGNMNSYKSKKVVVTGKLYHRVTAHQLTDIGIDLLKIEIIKKR